jgi:hypothetical protein
MEKEEGARYSHYSNNTSVVQLTFEFRSSILMTCNRVTRADAASCSDQQGVALCIIRTSIRR